MTSYTEREVREMMQRRIDQMREDSIIEWIGYFAFGVGVGAILTWWLK